MNVVRTVRKGWGLWGGGMERESDGQLGRGTHVCSDYEGVRGERLIECFQRWWPSGLSVRRSETAGVVGALGLVEVVVEVGVRVCAQVTRCSTTDERA